MLKSICLKDKNIASSSKFKYWKKFQNINYLYWQILPLKRVDNLIAHCIKQHLA